MKRAPNKPLPPQEELKALLDYDPDLGLLTWRPRDVKTGFNSQWAGKPAGAINRQGYATVKIFHTIYLAHRLIWKLVTGEDPSDCIDHRDLNRSNNKWDNLRAATRRLNQINHPAVRGKIYTPLKGVTWVKAKARWKATLYIDGKQRYLGQFRTPEEAHKAYVEAAEKHYGEFHRAS